MKTRLPKYNIPKFLSFLRRLEENKFIYNESLSKEMDSEGYPARVICKYYSNAELGRKSMREALKEIP